jgi:hypothetical protein
MNRLFWLAVILFGCINQGLAQTVSFNFSQGSQPVSGWVNAYGDPSSAVITTTDPTTGISVSSVATANWSPFGNSAHDGGGASGANPFFPNAVLANHWFNYNSYLAGYNALMPQLIISGLNIDSVYTFKMTGSFEQEVPSQFNLDPIRYTVAGATLYGYIDIDGDSNVTAGATFHNVAPDSTGSVRIYVNTYDGSNVASICGVQIISGRTAGTVPTVILTKPTNNTILPEDGSVAISATASDSGGTIAAVQFYAGSTLIGTDSTAPYSMTWVGPDPGAYTITARAIDGLGNIATASANITVESLNYFWSTTGNIATNGDSNFIGTVDTNRLSFRTNDIERMSISPTGTVMIGTQTLQDSAIIRGSLTVLDTSVNYPLTFIDSNAFSPWIKMSNPNPGIGASMGMRYFNDSGLVAQFFSGSSHDYYVPNGYAFHQVASGGMEFVGGNPTNYVSWGNDWKVFGGSEMIFYPNTGDLILGSTTDNGVSQLQVHGNTWTSSLSIPTGATAGYVLTSDASGNATWQPGSGGRWLYANGTVYDSLDNIGIGTNNTQGYKLAVNGAGIFTKIVAKPQTSWPDYVFDKGYELLSLAELEQYIRVHHHLPGITPEAEVMQQGIDLGAQQTSLLKKVEELTLYLIHENQSLTSQNRQMTEQAKQLADQNKQLSEQNARLEAQQKEIDDLKAMIRADHKQ